MWDYSVVTNAGKAILEQWAAGGTLTVDGATAGTGVVDVTTLRTQTALLNQKQTLTIKSYREEETGVNYKVNFTAADAAYTCNQIGIFGHIGSGTSTLIALYQDADGIAIPSAAEMANFSYAFYAIVKGNNESGTLVVETRTGTVEVSEGGTGADNAADALVNLGIFYADTLPETGIEGQICLVPES